LDLSWFGSAFYAHLHPIAVHRNSQTPYITANAASPLNEAKEYATLAYCLSNARSNFEKRGHCLRNKFLAPVNCEDREDRALKF